MWDGNPEWGSFTSGLGSSVHINNLFPLSSTIPTAILVAALLLPLQEYQLVIIAGLE